jgi:hypothetical protein
MEFDELQLLLIQIVLGAQQIISNDKGFRPGCMIELKFSPEFSLGHENKFWVSGIELARNGNRNPIGGQLECHKGADGRWCHGEVSGNVYLQYAGKCPVDGEYVQGQGMKVVVRKDVGVYRYETVGEFTI